MSGMFNPRLAARKNDSTKNEPSIFTGIPKTFRKALVGTEVNSLRTVAEFSALVSALVCGSTPCLDVVGPQGPGIPNVKSSISNHRMRIRRVRVRRALFRLRLSRAVKIPFPDTLQRLLPPTRHLLSMREHIRAHRHRLPKICRDSRLPHYLPRRELNGDYFLLRRITAIKVVTDQHGAAETVRKAALEVDLFRRDSVAVRLPTDESASYGKCPSVHISVTRRRRENLRRALDHFLVAPEKLPRLRIHSDDAFAQKLHILFSPAPLHDNRRRITRRVATEPPISR